MGMIFFVGRYNPETLYNLRKKAEIVSVDECQSRRLIDHSSPAI